MGLGLLTLVFVSFFLYNKIMKKFFTFTIVCMFVSIAQAQTPVKILRQGAKARAVVPTSAVENATIAHYNGVHGALMGIDYQLVREMTKAADTQVVPVKTLSKRNWLEQQKRNYKAAQLKKQRHRQQFQALQKMLKEQELELAKVALPPLVETKKFQTNDFADFVPVPRQQPKPTVPYVAQPGSIAYRGLALAVDGNSVRNILKNGLRVQDAGEENSTLRLAYASHGGYDAMRFLLENPVTNLTYGPKSAAAWGARRLSIDLPILTLVKVKGTFVGDSLETVTEDIPASDIEELAVRLNLEGNLTWCKVTLNEDDSFTLTPYEPFYKEKK